MYSCFQCCVPSPCCVSCIVPQNVFVGKSCILVNWKLNPTTNHKNTAHTSKPQFPRLKNSKCAAPRQCVCFESSLIPVWLLWQLSSGEHHRSAAKVTKGMTKPIQPTNDFVLRRFISMWIERYQSRKSRINEEDDQMRKMTTISLFQQSVKLNNSITKCNPSNSMRYLHWHHNLCSSAETIPGSKH